MNFQNFKERFLKEEVKEYPNTCLEKDSLVSVRVLAYNHAEYVARCLDSILMQQTSFDFDIVLAEDNSHDGTREICIEYAKRYPDKIRLLLNSRKNNIAVDGKPSGIFNSVYSNFPIESKYIAMCEADDYWIDPHSLQKRALYLEEHNDHVMSFHNAMPKGPTERTFKNTPFLSFNESLSIKNEEFINFRIPTSCILYRNHLIEKFELGMTQIMIGDILLRGKLSQFGKGRYLHNIAPSVYTIHSGGIFSTLDFEQKLNMSIEVRKYLLKTISNLSYGPVLLQKISLLYLTMFFNFLKKRKHIRLKILLQSLSYARQSQQGFRPVFNSWYKKAISSRNTAA